MYVSALWITLTLAALVDPVATDRRLAAMGVVALGTGLILLAVVGEGCLADVASPLVERVEGRDLAEFDLAEPISGWG